MMKKKRLGREVNSFEAYAEEKEKARLYGTPTLLDWTDSALKRGNIEEAIKFFERLRRGFDSKL